WQKRTGGAGDLRTALAVQYAASLAVTAPVALVLEGGAQVFDGSWQAWAGLLWASLGLSVGAVSLLLVLIRRGAVAGVATLLYLVPPVAAAMAFAAFGEVLAPVQVAGMAVAVAGVALSQGVRA
ncbi:MAG: EamA family transporter, partial [Janthinobacterium lividum]